MGKRPASVCISRSAVRLSVRLAAIVIATAITTWANAQTVTADQTEIIGGSTQTVTVNWSCGALGNQCQLAVAGPLDADCLHDGSCTVERVPSGTIAFYSPRWIPCQPDSDFNPFASCAPFQASVSVWDYFGHQLTPAVPIDIQPNRIAFAVNPTRIQAFSQVVTLQMTLQAPVRVPTYIGPILGRTSGSTALIENAGWHSDLFAAGQSSITSIQGTLGIPGNQAVTDHYLVAAAQVAPLCAPDPSVCQFVTPLTPESSRVFLAVYPQLDPGPCDECEATAGAPINLMTGDVWLSNTEYSVHGLTGGLLLTRTWNSLWNQSSPLFSAGMFGSGWTSSFEERLQVLDSTHIKYWRATGNTWLFSVPSSCTGCAYTVMAPGNAHASLTFNSTTARYTLVLSDGTSKVFNNSGYLLAVVDRNGNQTLVTYDASNRISTVTAPGGQSVSVTYGNPLIPSQATSIQDSAGVIASYAYVGTDLAQAVYADASQLNYSYDAGHNIISVTDGQGKVLEAHTYDGQRARPLLLAGRRG